MCGIAGLVSLGLKPIDPHRLKPMCDILAHRGPDDAGYAFFRLADPRSREGGYWCGFADPAFRAINEHLPVLGGTYAQDELGKHSFSVALGHRRLSIIDLSHYGHQPMASSDRQCWVVFNGEIYNYRELRKDLDARGHVFRTRSDTEVLLHLWEEHDLDCLKMLDGMFAFALYDRVRNRLTLARDRFGVKPLYFSQMNGNLLFGSEIKALLASGLTPPGIDPCALAEYCTFQNIFSDRTLFSGIRMLPAGAYIEIRPGSEEEPRVRFYHDRFPSAEPELRDHSAITEEVAAGFEAAVRRQLVSDVPVGSYLSGGMDSGSIVAVAGRSIPRLLTFTGGFDLTNVNGLEQGFDERPLAEKLAYLLQTEHYDVVLHAGDMPAAMDRVAWHMDDPRVGMCHQNWYVAKLASRFVKVCLAGAGGDELFGGYPWRYRNGLGADSPAAFDEAYFQYWHRLLPGPELPSLLTPEIRQCLPEARAAFDSVMASAPEPNGALLLQDQLLERAFYFEFKTFLHGFLVTEDHISMAHSLETRVPFLDNALVDLAFRIPPSLKVNLQQMKDQAKQVPGASSEGKLILRRAMERYLPAEFTRQRKQGFSPPDENWYRGPSMDYIKQILQDRRTRQRSWFEQQFVGACLEEHFQGRRNHRLLIWSLLSLELLQRHFLDQPVAPCPS